MTKPIIYRARCPLCATGEVSFTHPSVIEPESVMADARRIIRECAEDAGLLAADLIGPSRVKRVVEARHFAEWRMRRELDMSLKNIGRVVNRDHSTVIYGIQQIENARVRRA